MKSFSKYKSVRTVVEGISFPSNKEAKRYQELNLVRKAGEIKDLERQVKFKIIVKDVLICNYIADFVYRVVKDNRIIVEDTKGFRTPEYKLKKKLFEAIYGMAITET